MRLMRRSPFHVFAVGQRWVFVCICVFRSSSNFHASSVRSNQARCVLEELKVFDSDPQSLELAVKSVVEPVRRRRRGAGRRCG